MGILENISKRQSEYTKRVFELREKMRNTIWGTEEYKRLVGAVWAYDRAASELRENLSAFKRDSVMRYAILHYIEVEIPTELAGTPVDMPFHKEAEKDAYEKISAELLEDLKD